MLRSAMDRAGLPLHNDHGHFHVRNRNNCNHRTNNHRHNSHHVYRHIYPETEISCCIKYLVFGSNILFWVILMEYNIDRTLKLNWSLFSAYWSHDIFGGSLGANWKESTQSNALEIIAFLPRSSFDVYYFGRPDVYYWIFGLRWCSSWKY